MVGQGEQRRADEVNVLLADWFIADSARLRLRPTFTQEHQNQCHIYIRNACYANDH